MKLFILGAGASKAYSQSKTGVRMPIACDFFDTFDKLKISENPWVLQGDIGRYIIEKYKTDPYTYLRSGIDIEDFHSTVERDLSHAFENSDQVESITLQMTYNQLVYIFSSVINEIQNGPTSVPHIKLVRSLNEDDVIATFNWDTLIDRALKEERAWNTSTGYGFVPKSIYKDCWIPPSEKVSSNIQLYKLHGSTNWLTVHPTFMDDKTTLKKCVAPDDVYVYESTKSPYPCHRGRFMDNYEHFSYGYYPVNLDLELQEDNDRSFVTLNQPNPYIKKGLAPSNGVVSIPLIIPPVKEKKYEKYGNLFETLWGKTANAIETADEIIFIGYSFPKTDTKSTQLFVKSLMKRINKPKIKILDPFPEKIIEKFKFEFGFIESEITVYKDYFSEDFDIENMIKDS